MAGRFNNPFPQYFDSTPTVYSGGSLRFDAAGTSTPQNTYSDNGLTSPNTNPVVLNSAGRPAVDIFLQDLSYKVTLKDVNGNTIWTADNYTARDSKVIAKTLTGSGSPTGVVAGTAGSSSVLPDFYWDFTNAILYVCTATGTSSTSVWTAVNASTAAAVVPAPQGYLTLTSGTPVIVSDVTAATAVYYTPDGGNTVPIYNGSAFIPVTFTELTLSLVASHAASNIYDVFVFNNSGVPTIVTGPSWSAGTSGSITAGSCARGTGAGGTAYAVLNGIKTNAVQITGRNGSTTYTIGANLATLVGSLFMDGTNGQITCHVSAGQSRKWGVSNAYKKRPLLLIETDSTATWTQPTASWRQSNGSSANFAMAFCGLPEETVRANFKQNYEVSSGGTINVTAQIGIGINSTTSPSGVQGQMTSAIGAAATMFLNAAAATSLAPAIGINQFNAIEQMTVNSAGTLTMQGASTNMRLELTWMG